MIAFPLSFNDFIRLDIAATGQVLKIYCTSCHVLSFCSWTVTAQEALFFLKLLWYIEIIFLKLSKNLEGGDYLNVVEF